MARSSSPAADVPWIILAGGLATRMRPYTDSLPKMLLPVAGEPFAAHQMRWLAAAGARRVVVATGYLGELIEAYIGDGRAFGLEVAYSGDGPHALGTGGATRQAVERFVADGPVGVLYGDSYVDVDLDEAVRAFRAEGLPALMVVFENHDQHDTSNAAFDGRLVRYEKGCSDPHGAGLHFIDYGLSIFDARLIRERIPADVPFDLSSLQAALAREGQLAGFVATREILRDRVARWPC